jgi:hypothetical protein
MSHKAIILIIIFAMISNAVVVSAQATSDDFSPPSANQSHSRDLQAGRNIGPLESSLDFPAEWFTRATMFGISRDELLARIQRSNTLPTVTNAQSIEFLISTATSRPDMAAYLNELVAAGRMTQAEADAKLSQIEQYLNNPSPLTRTQVFNMEAMNARIQGLRTETNNRRPAP